MILEALSAHRSAALSFAAAGLQRCITYILFTDSHRKEWGGVYNQILMVKGRSGKTVLFLHHFNTTSIKKGSHYEI